MHPTYDDVNRLSSATYKNLTTSAENNRYNVGAITYDANGNIKTLQQNGPIIGTTTFGLMDNLTYNRFRLLAESVTTSQQL